MKIDKTAVLLSTAYLPPIEYFCQFIQYDHIWIESQEHYIKQSYRNRCSILGANGAESLTIPIIKGNSRQAIKDTKISYDTAWQHNHWNAIVSAYNSTPFFEVLRDDFEPFFTKKYDYLLDFNNSITACVLDVLEIDKKIQHTKEFELFESGVNLREAIHPKKKFSENDTNFSPVKYSQVFNDRIDFTPNLSIIDLLFNSGSASYENLLKSITNNLGK